MNHRAISNGNQSAFDGELQLTKREWLAGLVFQQFLAGSVLPRGFDATAALALTASRAVEAADALLEALAEPTSAAVAQDGARE